MKISRRDLATALALVLPAAAQTSATAEDASSDDQVQRKQARDDAEALAKFGIEQTLEPTFTFRV